MDGGGRTRFLGLLALGSGASTAGSGRGNGERAGLGEQFLKRQLESVETTGKLDQSLQLQKIADLTGPSPIFSDQLKARVTEAHFEMTALSMGIQLELNAINHYQAQANRATDETVKQFFLGLVAWEQGHYQGLLNQQNELKGDYWSGSGFSPF